MKLTPSTRRWLAGIGVAGAFVAASASPAAAETTPRIFAFFPDTTVAAGTEGVVKSAVLYAEDSTVLRDVAIRYDYRTLAGKVTLTGENDSDDCTAPEAGVLVCREHFDVVVDPYFGGFPTRVKIAPTDAAKLDDKGDLKITVQTGDTDRATWTSQIRVGEGVDLAGGPDTELSVDIAKNYGNFSAPVTVSNVGGTTAKGVVALFDQDWAITPADRWSNCYYLDDILIACEFDEEIAAGETRSTTFHYSLRPDTYAPGTAHGYTQFITPGDFEDLIGAAEKAGVKTAKRGTGAKLTLGKATSSRAAQTDVDPTNNSSGLTVHVLGKRGADLEAIGAKLSGKKGEVVRAVVGVRNNGPATVDHVRSGSDVTFVDVTVPTGTTAVHVPWDCVPFKGDGTKFDDSAGKPGAAKYRCFAGPILFAGEMIDHPFGLRIDKVVPNATGSVQINVECKCEGGFKDDLKPANDIAKIVVNATGDGGQGGGGTLPITGSSTGLIAAIGALLLAAGAGGYVVARRRRTRFVA
ncbi:LPXTG cell wall anchor domain-containing protein [Micromonospora sp. NPDC048930]|uniref:LPXTG cell wall anchor domain-containing protein n=1 Tax=Micromonospora sp. NPDC048930 TaxID=3364261 RepID=UPI00371932FA